jgi:hypothetical protein
MKVLLGAAAAVMMLASPALAQTGAPAQCAAFTPAPEIPDGASASNTQMREAREALEAWRGTRATEIAACHAVLQQLQAQVTAGTQAHNAAVADTDATIAQFTAENTEHTARGGGQRRERGGVITRPDN